MAFLMASLLTSYPDAQCTHCLSSMLDDMPRDPPWAGDDPGSWQRMRARLDMVLASAAALDMLRSEYLEIFDRGRGHASLYETEYGREHALVKGHALADIAGFYRAFGLEFGGQEGVHEMLDHVSVELEFYALLLMKQEALATGADAAGQAIVLEAQQKFLDAHLGRFVSAIATRPGVTASAFYGPVLAWCRDLVAAECARLGVCPLPADWLSARDEAQEMRCGGNCAILEGPRGPVPAQ
jgi:nitrate reductase assembly molybdenum cofactor insertion protein NarJ